MYTRFVFCFLQDAHFLCFMGWPFGENASVVYSTAFYCISTFSTSVSPNRDDNTNLKYWLWLSQVMFPFSVNYKRYCDTYRSSFCPLLWNSQSDRSMFPTSRAPAATRVMRSYIYYHITTPWCDFYKLLIIHVLKFSDVTVCRERPFG